MSSSFFGSHPAEAAHLQAALNAMQLHAQPQPIGRGHPHNASVRPILSGTAGMGTGLTHARKRQPVKKVNTSANASPEAKTPLMLINEGACKSKKELDWKLAEVGENIQKTFTYTVTLTESDHNHRPGDLSAVGQSCRCKKLAKQTCAIKLLKVVNRANAQRLLFGLPGDQAAAEQFIKRKSDEVASAASARESPSNASPGAQIDAVDNPLAQVHLLCMAMKIPAPEYQFIDPATTGRHFVCVAKLGKFEQRGTGASKKEAKRAAVTEYVALLDKIKSGGGDVAAKLEKEFGLTPEVKETREKKTSLKAPAKIAKITPGPTLKSLETVFSWKKKKNIDFVELLTKIAAEHSDDIKMTFVDLPQRVDGSAQCHLVLRCATFVYFYGWGESAEAARQNGAYNALQWLHTSVNLEQQQQAEQQSS